MKKGSFFKLFERLKGNQKAWIFFSCLLLSIVFWVFTSLSRNYETSIVIPVSYRNIPFSHHSDNNLPKRLEFRFSGSGFELFRVHLRDEPDSILIDVGKLLNGAKNLDFPTIKLRNQFPGEHQANKLIPEIISFSFTPRNLKRVPVKINHSVHFQKQFGQAGDIILRPDSVDLSGPQQLLDKVAVIETQPVNLKNIKSNTFGSAFLIKDNLNGITVSADYVYYYLPVEQYTEGMIELPVELPVSQRSRITLFPNKVKVSFQVSIQRYRQISESDFQVVAEVPFPDVPNHLTLKLKRYPYGLHQIRLQPETVDYLISE
ncbi:MAG: YbbR-like domain-containing protein [Bacteroidia bacterium]|nr:YbbR-like domain-containing protein [Bacteroidia bacterium]